MVSGVGRGDSYQLEPESLPGPISPSSRHPVFFLPLGSLSLGIGLHL